ncbi:YciI family protein [Aeromonas salmonicida]|uniref:YciI family protein n=1 Tax=Aeromonas salmonicida TaxID=645 RepID=UPI003D199BB4
MFVVSLTYIVDVEDVEKHLAAHVEYLDKQYAAGHFLASGRKVPRIGGIILACVKNRAILDELLAEDPFMLNRVASYDIIEFVPTKTSSELSMLVQK